MSRDILRRNEREQLFVGRDDAYLWDEHAAQEASRKAEREALLDRLQTRGQSAAEERQALRDADRSALWKPFTQMAGYVEGEPLILREGRGNWLRDIDGRVFLDGVSSLWVSVHGHSHPTIVRRVREQLDTLDHATMLGPSTLPAVQLAEKLVEIAPGPGHLSRVFYSDSGSTAVEIAVKMAYQYFAQHREESQRKRNVFVTLSGAYHGDTLGSVSVGGIDLFHQIYAPLLFSTRQAPGPDPYHRAFGEDPVAHEAACLEALKGIFEEEAGKVAALVMEPLMQGAAGMLRHSVDFLRAAAALAREHGALLIIDESHVTAHCYSDTGQLAIDVRSVLGAGLRQPKPRQPTWPQCASRWPAAVLSCRKRSGNGVRSSPVSAACSTSVVRQRDGVEQRRHGGGRCARE